MDISPDLIRRQVAAAYNIPVAWFDLDRKDFPNVGPARKAIKRVSETIEFYGLAEACAHLRDRRDTQVVETLAAITGTPLKERRDLYLPAIRHRAARPATNFGGNQWRDGAGNPRAEVISENRNEREVQKRGPITANMASWYALGCLVTMWNEGELLLSWQSFADKFGLTTYQAKRVPKALLRDKMASIIVPDKSPRPINLLPLFDDQGNTYHPSAVTVAQSKNWHATTSRNKGPDNAPFNLTQSRRPVGEIVVTDRERDLLRGLVAMRENHENIISWRQFADKYGMTKNGITNAAYELRAREYIRLIDRTAGFKVDNIIPLFDADGNRLGEAL